MRSARQDLLQDIESYLCGEVPSPLAMKRAPRIEGWRVQVRRRGKEFIVNS